MAIRQIVKEGDSVLTKHCREVVKFDDRLAQLIDDMTETLHRRRRSCRTAGWHYPQSCCY